MIPKLFGVEMVKRVDEYLLGDAYLREYGADQWYGAASLSADTPLTDLDIAAANLEHAITEKLLTPLGITAKLERLERVEAVMRERANEDSPAVVLGKIMKALEEK